MVLAPMQGNGCLGALQNWWVLLILINQPDYTQWYDGGVYAMLSEKDRDISRV